MSHTAQTLACSSSQEILGLRNYISYEWNPEKGLEILGKHLKYFNLKFSPSTNGHFMYL
jgi:hypothetical protein